ncbi:FlgD immunoglobulin-like domain containing protein [Microbulbifer sp. TYP-18]|uniref:FlgD immunoglobulin-like domain containing protein n=1 Tax=Microbulbifer sp. TYP-18 TaxID=3230024 RepID=UPI0034C67AE8
MTSRKWYINAYVLFVFSLSLIGLSANVVAEVLLYPLADRVYDASLYVAGHSDQPNDTVDIELNGSTIVQTQSNATGEFAVVVALPLGDNQIRVLNVGLAEASSIQTVRYIETAATGPAEMQLPVSASIAAPLLDPLSVTSNGNPVTITGTAEPGSTVSFFVNGRVTRSIAIDASGVFSTWVPLEDGDNAIYAVSETAAGQSLVSNTVSTSYTNTLARTWSGSVSNTLVWTKGDGTPYTLNGNLTIPSGVTLWIQSGVEVIADGNYRMTVSGHLEVAGAAFDPVGFRPLTPACDGVSTKRQDWLGIEVLAGATATIDYAEMQCASKGVYFNGGEGSINNSMLLNNYSGIYTQASSAATDIAPHIFGNTIQGSEKGLYVDRNSAPLFSGGNVVTGNSYGIYVHGHNGDADQNPIPVVTGNSVYSNGYNYYARYFASAASTILDATGNWWGTINPGEITQTISDWTDYPDDRRPIVDYRNFLDAPNGNPVYTGATLFGPISEDVTLAGGSYLVLGRIEVATGTTLNIGPGVGLVFAGRHPLSVKGTLIVQGTDISPAVFKPTTESCESIHWLGIEVVIGAIATIEYAEVHCANRGIDFDGGEGLVRNSKLLNNATGIRTSADSPATANAPEISGNRIYNNNNGIVVSHNSAPLISGGNEIKWNNKGIYVNGNSFYPVQNPNPVVIGNSIYDNVDYNYYTSYFSDSASVTLDATGNWWGTDELPLSSGIYDWTDYPSRLPIVDYSGYLDGPNGQAAYTGKTIFGYITNDTTLSDDNYLALGRIEVAPGSTLTIEAGTRVNLPSHYPLVVKGNLVVEGNQANPVVLKPLTTACDGVSSKRKDWQGIEIAAGGSANIDYAEIHCADKGVYFNGGDGSLRNSQILNNYIGIDMEGGSVAAVIAPQLSGNTILGSAQGIFIYRNSDPLVSGGNIITGNGTAIYVRGYRQDAAQNPRPVVTGNSIYDNSTNYYTQYYPNGASTILDATNNWWGTVDPAQITLKIYDWTDSQGQHPVVDYRNFLDGPGGNPAYTGKTLFGPILEDLNLSAGSYLVLGRVEVAMGTTLSFAPGSEFQFAGDFPLSVKGTLAIQGTEISPVVFEPTTDACDGASTERADWSGIEVVAGAMATIDYAEIHCANIGIHFNGGDGAVSNSQLLNNYYGIYMQASSTAETIAPQVSGNTIRGGKRGVSIAHNSTPLINGGNEITGNERGIHVYGNSSDPAKSPVPVVTDNSIYDNSEYNYYAYSFADAKFMILNVSRNWWGTTDPMQIAEKIYDWTDANSTSPVVDYRNFLDGPEGNQVHPGESLTGYISEDVTLTGGSYLVLGRIEVASGVTLTIDPGTELNFSANYPLQVKGDLVVTGSQVSPVIFKPTAEGCDGVNTERSDWPGIEVIEGATATVNYAEVHCANIGVHFNGGDGTVSNSQLQDNYYGIYMQANSALEAIAPEVFGNTIRGSKRGISIAHNSAPLISGGNTITGNERGIHVYGNNSDAAQSPSPIVTGNRLYGNSEYNYYAYSFINASLLTLDATGNWWGAVDVGAITASIYDNNDNPSSSPLINFGSYLEGIEGQPGYNGVTLSGAISEDIVLPAGEHLILQNVTVEPGVTLTLEAGASLKAVPDQKLQVAGTLIAQGTPAARVTFTPPWAGLTSGQWYGIEVISGGSVNLDYVRVEGATYGLDFNGGQGTVRHSLFRFNTYGIYIRAGSDPLITDGNEITLNDYGIYVISDGTAANNPAPVITGNSLYGNSQYDYYAKDFGDSANTILDITGNWWGTADAATIATQIYTAAATSPQVDFSGYLPAIIGQPAVSIGEVSLQNAKLHPLAGEQVDVTFGLNRGASVTLEIRREEDNALVYQTTQSYAQAGDYPIQWDGRDNQGAVQAQGLYRAVLRADDGLDGFTFDEAPPSGVGGVYGSVPNRYDIYANEFYKIPVNMSVSALVTMQVTPSGESAFNAFEDVYYESGQHWFYWDGRDPSGEIIDSSVSIFYPAPKLVRSTAIYITDTAPRISGAGAAPAIEVKADPYRVSHSYGQQTRMAYQVSNDAIVTFSLLPPGIVDPQHPSAIVLVDQELVSAQDATGEALLHEVEWRGYNDTDSNAIVVGDEGVYTFAIQAQSPETGESSLYRGVVNLYR